MATTKSQWVRPAARPITTSEGRADVRDVPVQNQASALN
jgi:hypothetical protein